MMRKILLVEDDNAIAIVIRAALEDEGFTVEATDSVAGRDRLLAKSAYDVMLTDVLLTDGDGLETLGAVRNAWPAMPVIVLSAQNTLDTAVRATGGGAFEYFPKPFDLDELIRATRQAGRALTASRWISTTRRPSSSSAARSSRPTSRWMGRAWLDCSPATRADGPASTC